MANPLAESAPHADEPLIDLVFRWGPLPVDAAVECVVELARLMHRSWLDGAPIRLVRSTQIRVRTDGQIMLLRAGDPGVMRHPYANSLDIELDNAPQIVQDAWLAMRQPTAAFEDSQQPEVYRLGCVLHYLLTRQPVHPAHSALANLREHLDSPPPSLLTPYASPGAELDAVFAQLLDKGAAPAIPTLDEAAFVLASAVGGREPHQTCT